MQDFRQVYAAFVKGEADFASLASSLEAFLQQHPDQGAKIQMAMAKLHQFNKLSVEEFRQILGIIAQFSSNTAPTQVREAAPAPAADGADGEADAEENSDSTVVRRKPEGSATQTSRTSRSQFTWTGFGEGEYINLEVGMVLKDRFLLEGVIGEGGMGFIFKAKDLRKEEAQDRNPYIAIKVLNESFKDHPEALKALQREARKSQDLSHPNIITVFDFDRDGDNVYMTMELMEGTPLDKFIKTLKNQPISVEEALRITQEMGQALAYAHSKNIVHSDFKPGNVFLRGDHSVKVFDFGIARASKQGLAGATGEVTKFDAGTLGALTPAYASLEMMLGEEPDPRDDIYALACVCHELLTGKHPFEKKSADIAMANKMTVAPIKGLDRKQMKGLLKGLAFKREDRSESVEQFLEDIRKVRLTRKEIGVRVGAVVVLAGVLAVGVPIYLDKRTFDTLSASLRSGNLTQVATTLDTVDRLDDDALRSKIISDTENQRKIIDYITQRIDELFNLDKKLYGYLDAKALIERGLAYYRDSASLKTLAEATERTKDTLMLLLDTMYSEYISTGKLLEDGTEQNVPAVLAIVRKVEPDSYLLRDKRLPDAYLTAARQRFGNQDLDGADQLVNAGLQRFADDVALVNMQDIIAAERQRLEQLARIATLSQMIDAAVPGLTADSDVSQLSPAALELRGLEPGNDSLERLHIAAEALGETQAAAAAAANDWTRFEATLTRYKQLASPLWVARKRGQLAKAQGQYEQVMDAMQQELAALVEKIDLRLAKPEFKPVWEAELRLMLLDAEAVATVLERQGTVVEVKQRMALAYVNQASASREKQRFAETAKLLATARTLAPELAELGAEQQQLAAAEAAFEAARQAELRLARIEGLKQSILTQTRANDVKSAARSFAELASLAPEDAFLTGAGKQALVDSYGRAAKAEAAQQQYELAVAHITAALALAPDNLGLKAELKRYSFELDKQRVIAAFHSPTPDSLLDAEQRYNTLRQGLSPTDTTALQNDVSRAVAAHIKVLATSNVAAAHLALPAARRIFGDLPAFQEIVLPEAPAPVAEPTPPPVEDTGPKLSEAELLEKLANEGDPISQFALATEYYQGNGREQDLAKAAQWYEKVAQKPASSLKGGKGQASPVVIAQSTLAGMYFEGKGVPKDMKQSFEWHRKAAENGFASSQNVVATYYLEGKQVVKQDYAEAFKWFTKASNQGLTDSQSGLGLMYFQGWGVAQDLNKAHELFTLAGKKGDMSSQSALGVMYFVGLGVPKDMQKAWIWTQVAVNNGHKDEDKILEAAAAQLTPEQLDAAKKEAATLSKAAKKKRKS